MVIGRYTEAYYPHFLLVVNLHDCILLSNRETSGRSPSDKRGAIFSPTVAEMNKPIDLCSEEGLRLRTTAWIF